jgi:hypothetical protein
MKKYYGDEISRALLSLPFLQARELHKRIDDGIATRKPGKETNALLDFENQSVLIQLVSVESAFSVSFPKHPAEPKKLVLKIKKRK